jgi:hypothetical protein
MNLFEFFYFACYLSMLTIFIVSIQIYNPGKQLREALTQEESQETFAEKELEETDSEEETSPHPELETFTMTESPLFRKRNVSDSPSVEQVD